MKVSSTRTALRQTQATRQQSSDNENTSSSATPSRAAATPAAVSQLDGFDAAVRSPAATVGADFVARTSTRVGGLASSTVARSSAAAAHIDALSGKGALAQGRNGMLMNKGEEGVEAAGSVAGGVATLGATAVTAKGLSALPLGVVAGGAAGTVATVVAAGFGGGVAIGLGFNKGWETVFDKSLGDSIYDWMHPEDNQPAQMPAETPSDEAGSTSGADAGSEDAGATSGTSGTGSADGGTEAGAAGNDEEDDESEGDGETSATSGSDDAGSADGAEASTAPEENDNDGDGKPDDDGTTPIHDETGPYVPLVVATGGRLGREQAERDEDTIEVATGADVSDPIEEEGDGSGGGVTVDATGGGHDRPERSETAGLEARSVAHVGFQLSGGGTINPATLAAMVGIRA